MREKTQHDTEQGSRQFKGVWLPADIFLASSLSPLEKILWADIDSFTSEDGRFYKSNPVIAEQYGVGERSISRAIAHLKSLDLIAVEVVGGRQRTIRTRKIDGGGSPNWRGSFAKLASQGRQIGDIEYHKRIPLENTKEREYPLPFATDLFEAAWEEWIAYRRESKYTTSKRSMKASLTTLLRLCGGDERTAIEIINQSIANGWKGFYDLKTQSHEPRITPDGLRDFVNEG